MHRNVITTCEKCNRRVGYPKDSETGRCICGWDAVQKKEWSAATYRHERLGDFTERQLRKLGITKERYVEVKKLFGLSPICHCDKRKEWLNKVSDWWRNEA